MAPTVSVLMPAFNAAGTIAPAVRSVLIQTRTDFELIIVDDGSTDATVKVLGEFLDDARVQLVSQENRGLAGARNTALAHAAGRYVSLLDSDDLWLPMYLEAVLATLEADPGLAYAYPDAWVLDEARGRIRRASFRQIYALEAPPREPGAFLRRLVEGNFVLVAATMQRELVQEAGGYDESLRAVEDYDLWLRLASRGRIGGLARGAHVVYRERHDSLTRNEALMATCLSEVYRRVAEEYDVPDDVRAAAKRRRQRFETKLRVLAGRPRALAAAYRLKTRLRSRARSLPWVFHGRLPPELSAALRQVGLPQLAAHRRNRWRRALREAGHLPPGGR